MEFPRARITEDGTDGDVVEPLQYADAFAVAASQDGRCEVGFGFIERGDSVRFASRVASAGGQPGKQDLHAVSAHRSSTESTNRVVVDHILRTHFTHWLVLAEDEQAVAAKVARYFPDGLDAFWGAYLVACTPEAAAEHYQAYVDAGIEYFIVQTLDPDDEETVALVTSELLPRLQI